MAATGVSGEGRVSCHDFAFFQEVMKTMRQFDDRIIHALNTSIPTDSFATKINATDKCKELYDEMLAAHTKRRDLIKSCVAEASDDVTQAKSVVRKEPDDVKSLMQLRKQQTKLRLMQSELNVEEVVNTRTKKVFYERCRLHYVPPEDL